MSLFQIYDGPGPVRRFEISELVLGPQIDVFERDARAAPGLYIQNTAPIFDPQTEALQFAPVVEWPIEEGLITFGEVSYA